MALEGAEEGLLSMVTIISHVHRSESPSLTFGARLDILRLENTCIFAVGHDLLWLSGSQSQFLEGIV